MGFSELPPRPSTAAALQTIDAWSPRADAGLTHIGVPWRSLLTGTAAAAEVRTVRLPLIQLYRARHFAVVVTLDVTNGLARSEEAPELVALGRSITEPAVQALYREYVAAIDTILHPDYLGLAAETNLIRVAAPRAVYDAVRAMTDAAANDAHARRTTSRLYVSVQVETAWGRLQQSGQYVGVADDRRDFPFIDALGLSSYPYLGGFATPEQVPVDYYARLVAGSPLPLLVVEGGWASASAPGFTSSPALQAAWIRRQAQLLDSAHAVAVFQIEFADLDLSTFPQPQPPILPLFATLGLVDANLRPKPALSVWDSIFARPLQGSTRSAVSARRPSARGASRP